jgi:hypothetical protein
MDASNFPWVLQQLTVVAFVGIGCGVAWKDDNPKPVADSRDVLRGALDDARLPQNVAAIEVAMDEGTFSRRLDEGGAFFARLMDLGRRQPAFGAALHRRIGELLRVSSESPVERLERLVLGLYQLPQKEPVKCAEVRRQDSSAA